MVGKGVVLPPPPPPLLNILLFSYCCSFRKSLIRKGIENDKLQVKLNKIQMNRRNLLKKNILFLTISLPFFNSTNSRSVRAIQKYFAPSPIRIFLIVNVCPSFVTRVGFHSTIFFRPDPFETWRSTLA